jgi:8-amino-7-oxononanoate synthase
MGTQGGLILGSGTVMQSIINFGDSAIYTTAVSGMHIQELSEKLNLVKAADEPRSKLAKIIAYFNATFGNYPGFQPKKGPIQAIKVSSPEEAVQLKEFLAENKLSVSAVRYPTVAKGDDRLRISLHSYNTKEEVLELRHVIERFK